METTEKIAIKPEWKKSCLCLGYEEFEALCEEATGVDDLQFHYDMDGLWIEEYAKKEDEYDLGNEYDLGKVVEALSEALGITITSIHIDDCDMVGVWIVYKPE